MHQMIPNKIHSNNFSIKKENKIDEFRYCRISKINKIEWNELFNQTSLFDYQFLLVYFLINFICL